MRRSRVRFLVAAPGACARGGRASRADFGGLSGAAGARICRGSVARSASLTSGARRRTISRLLRRVPGGVPEWPKGPDCKSDGSAFVGSNPTPSTTRRVGRRIGAPSAGRTGVRGYSSVVEPQPSKLMARVQFPLPAPRDVRQDIGDIGKSNPGKHTNAHIAQSAERVLGKDEVIGSNPIVSTKVSVGRTVGLGAERGVDAESARRGKGHSFQTLATPI